MDDQEVISIAVFKLGEAASRLRALGSTVQAASVQRLLAAAAQVLAAQQKELRVFLESGRGEAEGEPRREEPPPRGQARSTDAPRGALRLATGGRK